MPIIYIADKILKNKLSVIPMKDEFGSDITWECFPTLINEDDNIQIENDTIENPGNQNDDDEDHSKIMRGENEIIYTSRSGFNWSTEIKNTSTVTPKYAPGKVVNGGKNVVTIQNAFKLFINGEIILRILNETNQFCQIMLQNVPIAGKAHEEIKIKEMYAFIAILLVGGMKCKDITQLAATWDEAETNSRRFHNITMDRHRFFYIYGNIQFDNMLTRQERFQKRQCKYEAIYSIFDIFKISCGSNYSPGKDINVGKRVAEYKGRCPFRVQENPVSTPGIRLWVAADSKSLYISNLIIDEGKNTDVSEETDKANLVKKLVSVFYGSGRGITTHSSVTSIELAEYLISKNLRTTGILTLNKKDIPDDLTKPLGRTVGTSICVFTQNLSLISYSVLSNRILTFLSTENQKLCEPAVSGGKPQIVQHQLETNGSVRRGMAMAKNSTCAKETESWSFRIFMELIDIAVLNSFAIWLTNYPNSFDESPIGFRHFIADLATQLALDNINQRELEQQQAGMNSASTSGEPIEFKSVHEMINHLPLEQQRKLHQRISVEPATSSDEKQSSNCAFERTISCDSTEFLVESCDSTSEDLSGRCDFCPVGRERKTRMICVMCHKKICNSHRHFMKELFCFQCSQNNNEQF